MIEGSHAGQSRIPRAGPPRCSKSRSGIIPQTLRWLGTRPAPAGLSDLRRRSVEPRYQVLGVRTCPRVLHDRREPLAVVGPASCSKNVGWRSSLRRRGELLPLDTFGAIARREAGDQRSRGQPGGGTLGSWPTSGAEPCAVLGSRTNSRSARRWSTARCIGRR